LHNSGTQGDNLIQLVEYWTHCQKWCVPSHTKLRFSCSVSFLLKLHLFVIWLLQGTLFQPFSCSICRVCYMKPDVSEI